MFISEDKQHCLLLAISLLIFILLATGSTGLSQTPDSPTIIPTVI
ncbi:hypothetical protein [Pseudobacteroides cellulosolvens]|uniref:Uncharacterized protein n=1 Tax=Pseudobacteroides cellulosolvens ATCC 35603 = DSM 2933 TaxID=398512 RepID=A0A0L6JT63_9FIRM|nr:hypothetical protein [Pseudobacteroides cellulosolvens]KNY28875.1 hypothetical protein Bccel_4149 [Pseudobacteroides cellulosolvens ATCC 35603 = DSM 2933]